MLLIVGESRQTVLTPVIGTGTGLVMAEVVPGISIFAVVLPHRAPLPLTKVGAPLPPVDFTLARLCEALLLRSGSFDCVGLCLHPVPPELFLCLSDTYHPLTPATHHSFSVLVTFNREDTLSVVRSGSNPCARRCTKEDF